jgi:hypothetical protein
MTFNVFISHNSEDCESVRRAAKLLLEAGVKAYTYEQAPQPGIRVSGSIQETIDKCDALIALMSGVGSNFSRVQQEIGCAELAGKLIVPLVERSVDRKRLAMLRKEYVAFDQKSPYEIIHPLATFLKQRTSDKRVIESILGLVVMLLYLLAPE